MLPANTTNLTYVFDKPVGEFENFPNFISLSNEAPISFGISYSNNNGLSSVVNFHVSGNIMGFSDLIIRIGYSSLIDLLINVYLGLDVKSDSITHQENSNIMHDVFSSRSKIIKLHEKLKDYKYKIDKSKNISTYQRVTTLLFILDIYNFERKLEQFLEITQTSESIVY